MKKKISVDLSISIDVRLKIVTVFVYVGRFKMLTKKIRFFERQQLRRVLEWGRREWILLLLILIKKQQYYDEFDWKSEEFSDMGC